MSADPVLDAWLAGGLDAVDALPEHVLERSARRSDALVRAINRAPARVTSTGNRLAIATAEPAEPGARMMAEAQIAAAIERGRRDASDDPRWAFSDLDRLVNAMSPGEFWVVGGLSGNGKALALDTPLPTPTGWTTMGDVRVGDLLLDDHGRPCRVQFATEVQHNRDCFRVSFSDGAEIVADGEHRWETECTDPRNPAKGVHTTVEIAATLERGVPSHRARNHRIAVATALDLSLATLPIPPYTLGAWLGDGTSQSAAITCTEHEILDAICAEGIVVTRRETGQRAPTYGLGLPGVAKWSRLSLTNLLADFDLLGHKHIPPVYLRAAKAQRLELLRGIMDTDGYIARTGQAEVVSVKQELAEDYAELIRSLGHKATVLVDTAKINGREVGPRYRVCFWPMADDAVFRLPRKVARLPKVRPRQGARVGYRYIDAVTPVASVPVRCVQVDSPSHLYLAGTHFVATHNTSLLFSQMTAFADAGTPVVYLPLEMDPDELRRRWAAWTLGLDGEAVAKNQWQSLDLGSRDRHEREMARQADSLIQIPPDRRVTLANLAKWTRWGVAEVGARIIVIDHFHRMDFSTGGRDYRVQVSDTARAVKDMAREHGVVVLATAQLNNVHDPLDAFMPPLKQRLKESSALHEEPDVVLMLSRRLSGAVGREDLDAIKRGARSVRDFADPNVMVVTCRKHRLADSRACDHGVRLSVIDGKVGNLARSWHRDAPDRDPA